VSYFPVKHLQLYHIK